MDVSPTPARFPPDRLLLLALDAVPHRVAVAAYEQGSFAGWTPPAAVVAPFPSLTHPAFASLFAPFGVGPSWGYEVRYFDRHANAMAGGNPLTYRSQVPPWGKLIDSGHRGVVGKGSNYVVSMRAALAELDAILEAAARSDKAAYIGYLGSTDALMHLYGDESVVEFLRLLAERCERIRLQHQSQRRSRLRVVLFSDHGCGRTTVHYTGDIRPRLREAGLRVVDHLGGARDVVAPTFGIVNYLALFLADPERALDAASALVDHPAVELAAWRSAPDQVEVMASTGRARLRWTDHADERKIAYEYDELPNADILDLGPAAKFLRADGRMGADGFAGADDWLAASQQSKFPDGPARLVDALAGERVRSRATVLVSLGPGWSWGWRSAYLGTFVRSGRLKGTHGGLDRESSLAFLTVSDPAADQRARGLIRADAALACFVPFIGAHRIGAHR